MTLILRPPTLADETACRALHEQLAADNFSFLFDSDSEWSEILARFEREAAGVDLPENRVPCDFLVAEVDGTIVGRSSIRHVLTDFLLNWGGHVGYAVGPEYRRRGYATEILRLSVARLAGLGVERVLVTCDDDNVGSAAVIEACGGVLEDVRPIAGEQPKRRYWIDAGAQAT